MSVLTGAVLIAAACHSSSADVIRVDGSSTVYPLTEAVAEEFLRGSPDARITVGVAGTGGGFKRFCRGEIDIANASRPISPSEQAACADSGIAFLEIPVAYDGITVVVHPANDWVADLTVDELGRLWRHEAEGKVLRWSDLRTGFPHRDIRLYGAGVDSGTFDYFTEAVTGTARDSRGDYTSSEDDNTLVQGVAGDEGALGFFGFAYFEENRTRLRAVPIRPTSDARPIAPDVESIRTGAYRPLSRPVFIYVGTSAFTRTDVQAFVAFYLTHVGVLARDVGYVPLGEETARRVLARVRARTSGSIYPGEAAGRTLDERLGTR